MRSWKKLLTENDGTTAVEYAFLLSAILLASVATIATFSTGLGNIYTIINSKMSGTSGL